VFITRFIRTPFLPLVLLWGLTAGANAYAVEVTDVLGRKVEVPAEPKRVVLGEGRLFYALALLDRKEPFKRVIGWQNDMRLLDPHTYAAYERKYPQIKDIPVIGQASEQSVSAEQILNLKPDLAVFSIAGEGPTQHSPVADLLAQAGIPVLFIDFRVHPIKNAKISMTALGEVLGRQREAKAYLDFYDRHLTRITDAVANLSDDQRPSVFLELLPLVWQAPGHTTGKSGLGSVVQAVGGHNIAADVVPGALGDVNVEYVLERDPDIYIATGNRQPGLLLGAEVPQEQAQVSLSKVLARDEFAPLRAIREGRAHGLWHDFYNSPYNIIAIEAMATWIHPELFADIDPHATLEEVNGFLDTGLSGAYWVDAKVSAKP
jgi:iron complex transport system substrate-binding protein